MTYRSRFYNKLRSNKIFRIIDYHVNNIYICKKLKIKIYQKKKKYSQYANDYMYIILLIIVYNLFLL